MGRRDGTASLGRSLMTPSTNIEAQKLWPCLMHEGAAQICFVTQSQTIVRQEVIEKVGNKRRGEGRPTGGKMSAKRKATPTTHDSQAMRFFKRVLGHIAETGGET